MWDFGPKVASKWKHGLTGALEELSKLTMFYFLARPKGFGRAFDEVGPQVYRQTDGQIDA